MGPKFKGKRILATVLCLILSFSLAFMGQTVTVKAGAYDRESVSLNGTWNFYPNNGSTRYDIRVPSYWDTPEENNYPLTWRNLTYGVYKKIFTVPSSMSDSEIFLEIGALTALGEVYVNGHRVGGEETGNYLMMMLPYEIDVTPYVTIGQSNNLEIHVYGSASFPANALSSSGKFLYPVGTEFISGIGRRGICGDVKLISKPKVCISDVQIITDLNKNTNALDDTITLKISIDNKTSTSKTITVKNSAALVNGSGGKTFNDQSISIPANSSGIVTISNVSWTNASYWWPHDPKLYVLTTILQQNGVTIDKLDSKFGFRQFYCKPNLNYFELNGIRTNLRGDSLDYLNSERNRKYVYDSYNECPSNGAIEVVKRTLDEAKKLNMNVIRNHIRSFTADEIFDYSDEIGMMMIDEGPFWETHLNMDYGSAAIKNCSEWVKKWVKSIKNHPSIIMYSTTNEAWGSDDDTILMPALRQAVLSYDTTRPIYNDGEGSNLPCHDQINLHYTNGSHMQGFPSVVNHSNIYGIYSAGTTKPMGEGEAMTPSRGLPTLNTNGTFKSASGASFYGDDNSISRATYVRAVGRVTRGARYTGVADFRPFCDMFFAFEPIEGLIRPQWSDLSAKGLKPDSLARPIFNPYDSNFPSIIKGDGYDYYKNSFSPVAAFDKAFDNSNLIGVNPTIYYPSNNLTRTIVVYNDEFSGGTQINVNWEVGYKDPVTDVYTYITSNSFQTNVGYGLHTETNISFTIPANISGSKQLYLKLTAYKNSVQKFTESNMIGVINSIPAPKLTITNPNINLGTIKLEDSVYKHRIKLVNKGGGLAENWTANGYGDWLNLETTSGILRGEQEVYFTINTGLLNAYTNYRKTLTFTGSSGTSAQVTIEFMTGNIEKSGNLALYANVSASSSYERSGWGKSKAVDGETNSITGSSMGWTSDSNLAVNHTEWITVDLGTAYPIKTVDLYPRNDGTNTGYGFPINFTIQVSNDNSNWTTVVTKSNYAQPGNAVQRFSFTQTAARYIKIEGTSLRRNPNDGNQYRMQFAEIEIY